jgi:phage tail-like protein
MVAANVLMRGGETAFRVLVSGGSGNQVFAFFFDSIPQPQLKQTAETYPLRRYGGLALASIDGHAMYDSGPEPQWIPVVEKPRQLFARQNTLVSPVLDSGEPGAVWDRLRLDGCVPPGTNVLIEAKAGDLKDELGEWTSQPAPILSASGSELSGHSATALVATDSVARQGTFELLFQAAKGRYLQLRLTLLGDGDATPRLRALRAYWPRISWAEKYLPALYREDIEAGNFLDRYLANMQGMVAKVEDRIVTAQSFFDTRTVPAEALGWLAEWFDVALDPSWNEPVRRAFIANAVRFFGWRGTMQGLENALALAFGKAFDVAQFGKGACSCDNTIRIVETYRTRSLGRVGAGDSSGIADAPAYDVGIAERDRWIAFQKTRGVAGGALANRLPRRSAPNTLWAEFTSLAGHDRKLWQRFLQGRHKRISALNATHASAWKSFVEIPLFDDEPDTPAAQADWAQFEQKLLLIDRTAHRFSVLLPVDANDATDGAALEARRRLAARIINLEKPAHTVFDIRFYFAMNRIGEARLGMDTAIGDGSRSAETLPRAILGRAYIGESFVGPDGLPLTPDRARLSC